MSDASNKALEIFGSGDIQQALNRAIDAVNEQPNDWHCHYAVGVCLRRLNNLPGACEAYENALSLDPKQAPVLLALAIARQLNSQLEESVSAAKRAIELDPDYYLAFNTLGMTRKIQGEFEMASLNYEAGAEALSRSFVKKFVNKRENPRFPHGETRYNLWLNYAMKSSMFRAASDGIERVLLPTSEMAQRYYESEEDSGWLWEDRDDESGKKSRLFLPNFFGTMFYLFKSEGTLKTLLGNKSIVLRALGEEEEAEKHLWEADELSES